jgi:uncharacterized SAM-binding protein YcdF (DUF218 family)
MTDVEIAIMLIMSDIQKKSDIIVILEGDKYNRIETGVKLQQLGKANLIVFSGGIDDKKNGSYRYEDCKHKFASLNYNGSIHVDFKSKHTREQAENVIQYCIENSLKKIILVASNYHQIRAFMTFLKILIEKKMEKEIQIFNAPALDLKWFLDEGYGQRIDLLKSEFIKMELYRKKNDICDFYDVINYFKWREEIS